MQFFKNLKLSNKINFGIILTFIIIVIIFFIIDIPVQQNRLALTIERSETLLKTLVERDKEPLANEIFDRQNRAIKVRLSQMLEVDHVISIYVYNESGGLLEAEGDIQEQTDISKEELIYFDEETSIIQEELEKQLLVYLQEIRIIGERIGFIKIYYSIDDVINEQRISLLINILLLIMIFLIMIILLNVILNRTILHPITFLRDTIKRIRIDSLGETVYIKNNDEIGDLTNTFNKMSVDLNKSYKEIEYNKNYFDNLFNSLHSVLITVNESGTVKQWNHAAEIFFRISFNDAFNKIIWDLLPVLNKFKNDFQKVFDMGKSINLYKVKLAKEDKVYLNISLQPLIFKDNHDLVIVIDDVTAIEHKESQLRQTQKMEMIGTLASGLAHDFNNFLAGILGPVTVLKMKNKKDKEMDRDFLEKYINLINDSVLKASDIVEQLSGLSRKQELSSALIDLNNSVRNVAKIARNSFDKSVIVNTTCLEAPANINADATQIEQVILNICINAAHAMTIMRKKNEKWGGMLDVSIELIIADKKFCKNYPDAHMGKYFCISISDNGVGMDDEDIKNIFTPFFTKKEKGIGTGLGLSMVYNIVQQHQGFINVYSRLGIGTCFNIYLPEIKKENNKEIVSIIEKDFYYDGCILCIDDELPIHTIVKDMLEEYGMTVICANNGAEGLQIFEKSFSDIDLVILDLAMPGLSGKEVFKKLKKINPLVKVLLTSGYKYDKRVKEALILGINGFLKKPFTLESLINAVAEIIT